MKAISVLLIILLFSSMIFQGQDIIHSVTNPIPKLTGAIHIYGGDFFDAERSEWDPESLTEHPYDMSKVRAMFED